MENKGRKWFLIIASFVLALAILVGVGYAALFEKQNSQDIESVASDYKQEEEENYAKRALKILGEEAVVPKELSGAETLLVPSDFVNGYKEGLFNNRKATCNVSAKFSREDRLLLCFEAQTEIEYCEIKVEVYNAYNKLEKKATFYANTQLSVYYFPITGIASISKITFSASSGNGGVTVKRCTLLNNKEVLVPEYLSGAFVVDEVKNIVSKNPDVQIQSVIDTVCDQNYLYTVSNNKLTVCSLANPQRPTKIGSLEGIGLPRRVIIVKNNLLAVACLEYGVYLIDVSNPRTPKIAGHIEALEFSSGMDSKGDYLFIASRYSGIEVFNIADPANPNLCTVFRSNTEAERIDCEVYEDFLYVSIHSPNRIEIFDIGEVLNPRFIGSVATDGTPYGIDTYKDKLVVSTGYSSTKSKNDTIEDIGYGMGHAIELYDLKYPERPSFISLAKADGRYHRSTADYWNVRVSGNYAYHTDMHNGLYVVDLSNPKNPVRLCEMRVSYSSESERYSNIDGANSLFNFDTTKELRGCITGAAIYNGYVYVGESTGGIHVMKYDVAEYAFRDSVVMFKE